MFFGSAAEETSRIVGQTSLMREHDDSQSDSTDVNSYPFATSSTPPRTSLIKNQYIIESDEDPTTNPVLDQKSHVARSNQRSPTMSHSTIRRQSSGKYQYVLIFLIVVLI
jgi:deferrochelatase/peroxidase EfeB